MKRSTKFTKALAVLLCMVMVIGTFTFVPLTATAATAPAGTLVWNDGAKSAWPLPGSGTAEEPYIIETPADFASMLANAKTWYADFGEDKTTPHHFVLTSDLDFAGKNPGYISVSSSGAPVAFVLDGQGHTVYNLSATFGVVENLGYRSEIKNITFDGYTGGRDGDSGGFVYALSAGTIIFDNVHYKNSQLTATGSSKKVGYFGSYITEADVIFNNCSIESSTVSGTSQVGGFIGHTSSANSIKMTNCSMNGTVSGGTHTGGFFGYGSKATLTDCSMGGSVSSNARTGGFFGESGTATFTCCTMNGTINATGGLAAGFVANADGIVNFTNCVVGTSGTANKIVTTNGTYASGFIADCRQNATFENCINYMAVESDGTRAGGFIGYRRNGTLTMTNCWNDGDVFCGKAGSTSDVHAGGMFGDAAGGLTFTLINCGNTGNITGITSKTSSASEVGGLFGNTGAGASATLKIQNCYNTGAISAKEAVAYCGGIAGWLYFVGSGTISGVYSTGTVSMEASSTTYCKALFGCITGKDALTLTTFEKAYAVSQDGVSDLHNYNGTVSSSIGVVKVGELNDEIAAISANYATIENAIYYGVAIDISKVSLNIAEGSENLSIALRVKEPFGFSAATTVLFDGQKIDATDYIVGNDKLTFGFAFVPSVEPVTVDQILASDDMVFVEAEAHKDGNGKFISFYEELNVSNVDETVYFAAVILDARTGDVLIKSDARYLNPYSLVCQGAEGAILGNAVSENEQALYQAIVDYKVAYNDYLDSVGGKKN